MWTYLLRRLAYGFLVLALVTATVTGVIFLAPVDPAQLTFGQRSDVGTVKAKTAELGLDQPLYVQLGRYWRDLSPIAVHGAQPDQQRKYRYLAICAAGSDRVLALKWPFLRESYQSGRPVAEILAEALPSTALLAGLSMLMAAVLGISLGIISALKQNGRADQFISVITVLGYSIPSYVVAMFLALTLGYALGAWTGLNIQGSLFVLGDFGEWELQWKNLILPTLALGLRPVALITQLTRSAMLEVMTQDYMRTAFAKGLPTRRVFIGHGLRNALNPIISAISGWFAALLTGAFFIENVFNFKGMGNVAVQALMAFDIPVVLGCVLCSALLFIVVNMIADLLLAATDPRIQLQ